MLLLANPAHKVQTRIFSHTYNPHRLRTGNSVLRQRLKGPSVAAYYPRRVATFKDLKKTFAHFDEDMETWDDDEEDRLEHIAAAKSRGKGAPKKKKSADGQFSVAQGLSGRGALKHADRHIQRVRSSKERRSSQLSRLQRLNERGFSSMCICGKYHLHFLYFMGIYEQGVGGLYHDATRS